MARRGPKLNPALVRYIAAGNDPGVYVVEVAGMVKIGCSRNIEIRLRTLHTRHAKVGETLGRFWSFPLADRLSRLDVYVAEARGIEALRAKASAAPGRREYFTGIDFGTACAAVGRALQA